jgi:hypothetical protein
LLTRAERALSGVVGKEHFSFLRNDSCAFFAALRYEKALKSPPVKLVD